MIMIDFEYRPGIFSPNYEVGFFAENRKISKIPMQKKNALKSE